MRIPSPGHRRLRQARVLSLRWQRRVVFVLGGGVVGLAAVLIAFVADMAGEASRSLAARTPYVMFALTPLGFAASSFISRRYFPNSGGSGIPQVIAARQLHGLAARERLVSMRVAFGKMVLLLLGLLCGGSIGREGPTVQIGASIMFAIGRLSPRRQPGLLLAGASAGVAAAFNTPLAGIVFGIEEMSRSFESRTSGIILGAVIAAGITSLSLQGDYTYFGTTSAVLGGSWQGWLAVPVIGILGGLFGGGFSRVLIVFGAGLPGRAGALVKRHPVWFAMLCGLTVAFCGLLSDGAAFGTGYRQARGLVQGQASLPDSFGALKFIATLASSVSGIPGGIFAPSLAVGAGLGNSVATLLPGVSAQALVVMGMVGYFSGVVQAPITAFVIVTEMTNDHALVLPLMLVSVIAFATSRLVCREGVYHALAHNFIAAEAARGGLAAEPARAGQRTPH